MKTRARRWLVKLLKPIAYLIAKRCPWCFDLRTRYGPDAKLFCSHCQHTGAIWSWKHGKVGRPGP